MRFNVAYCDNDRLFTLMDEALAACRQQGPRETRAAVRENQMEDLHS
jgi:hypothetical protein